MSSRLDRLLLLLDSGSSPSIRHTAARQIGQLAAKSVSRDAPATVQIKAEAGLEELKPAVADVCYGLAAEDWAEAMSVVTMVLPYLRSKSSETRSAAALALSHICSLLPLWSPAPASVPSAPENAPTSEPPAFPSFDLPALLAHGTLLLASSGKEYAMPTHPADLARARKDVMSSLGLGFLEGVGGAEDMDLDRDLAADQTQNGNGNGNGETKNEPSEPAKSSPPPPPTPAVASAPLAEEDLSGLSARERNRLKRKRKPGNGAFVAATSASNNGQADAGAKVRLVSTDQGDPHPHRIRGTSKPPTPAATPSTSTTKLPEEKVVIDPSKGGQVSAKQETAGSGAIMAMEGEWVWGGVVRLLELDLFSPMWEVRHGAAMGLREIVKVQGGAGGMKVDLSSHENALLHEAWCNALAAKFLCVFVLDRFGDFVSDQVVAPVRETVSQSLAALLLHMPRRSVMHVHSILLQMIGQDAPASSPPAKQTKSKSKAKDKGKTN
ncbi:TATA-binding protein-associated factor mot1, partial [Ceratobasidium sp. 392]